MRRLLAPTFVVPMGAAGLLALVFLYYYFPARMRREAIVNEQAFRQLGTYTDLIQNRIANYGTVVKQWATQADKQGGATTKGFADQVPELHYEKLPDDSGGLNVDVSSDDRGSIQLKLKYDHYSGGIPLEQLVSAFVTPQQDDGFDEVLIVNSSDGAVLYQPTRPGITLLRRPSVRTGKSGGEAKSTSDAAEKPPASGAAATTTDTVPIGGSQYRLYSSPLPIRLNRPNADPTLDWTMCGVISDSRMRSHILGTPGYVLVMVALALSLMLVTAWPALKFSTMRAGERVPRRAGVYYLATTVVAIILSVMLGIHIWSLTSDFDRTDEKLSLLADAIDANLTEETNSALKALHGAMNSSHFDAEAKELTVNKEPCGASEDLHTKDFQTRAVSNLLARKDVNLGGYPFFDQIFWTDRNGFQQMKWTIRPEATPTVRLCNYTFFTETLENHLWYFKDQPEGDKFRIDPMYSPNTGKYNALISQRSSRSNAGSEVIAMGSVVTFMLSLIDPVLPPDYGFAVVDPSGQVLFHSTSIKNGREHLITETDNDPNVRAALFSELGVHLTTSYHGRNHRLFVRPLVGIQGSNWTLVAFRDLASRTVLQLERMFLFVVLIVFYLILISLGPALLLRLPIYPSPWVWPQEKFRAIYLYLAICLLLAASLVYVLVTTATLWVAVPIAVLAPLCSVAAVIWRLRQQSAWIAGLGAALTVTAVILTLVMYILNNAEWSLVGPLILAIAGVFFLISSDAIPERIADIPYLPGCQSSYTALGTALIVMLAIVPCLGLFRVADAYEESRFTQRAQLETMAALEAREERVRQSYTNVQLTGSNAKMETVARALFLRSRIDEQTLDRYDRIFISKGETEYTASSFPWPLPQLLDQLANLWPFPAASGARQVAGADPQSARWKWDPEGNNRLRMRPRFVPERLSASRASPPGAALSRLVEHYPMLLSEDIVSELPARWQLVRPAMLTATIALLVLIFSWLRLTIGQMFLLNVDVGDSWPVVNLRSASEVDRNMILVGVPCSGKSQKVKELVDQGSLRIDLSELIPDLEAGHEPANYKGSKIPQSIIALDHFEYRCEDPEANRVKLELLEWLTHLDGKKILIFTTVDPTYYLEEGLIDDACAPEGFAPGKYLERWVFVLAGFKVRSLNLPPAKGNDQYQRLLWATCSRSERIALHQLARDGWPNHRNWRALDHLRRRALITQPKNSPVWEIDDPAFRTYIRESVNKKTLALWQSGEAGTAFDGFRIGAGILAIGMVIAILIYNQQQILAAVAAGASALAPLVKFFSGSGGQGSAAKGGQSE